MESNEIKVDVAAIATILGGPSAIILATETGDTIPIWVGPMETQAIGMVMKGIQPSRPFTHDLMKNFLDKYNVLLKKVVITDLRDHTFYALLYLESNGEASTMDCRPSDAIALALRVDAPIYVEGAVFQKVKESRPVPAEGKKEDQPPAPDIDDHDWDNIPKH